PKTARRLARRWGKCRAAPRKREAVSTSGQPSVRVASENERCDAGSGGRVMTEEPRPGRALAALVCGVMRRRRAAVLDDFSRRYKRESVIYQQAAQRCERVWRSLLAEAGVRAIVTRIALYYPSEKTRVDALIKKAFDVLCERTFPEDSNRRSDPVYDYEF